MYTNADGLLNKRDLLTVCTNIEKPDIVMVSEVIPKAQKLPITAQGLAIPGFRNAMTNFNPEDANLGNSGTRGLAVYIKDSLSISPVKLNSTFKEYLAIEVSLTRSDKLLLVLIYRNRQGLSDRESTDNLCKLLHELESKNASHMIIAGDFNMKEIDWNNNISHESPNHFCQLFLSCTQECFLHQHVSKPTRFRHGETPSTLDLIFSTEEAMVQDVKYLAPLGHSDHSCLIFHAIVSTQMSATEAKRLNISRGDYDALRRMLEQVNWDSFMIEDNVEGGWRIITTELNKATANCIPMVDMKLKRNLFMDLDTVRLRRRKNKMYAKYLRTKDDEVFKKFATLRNKLRKKTRELRRNHEIKLVREFKEKPKPMWKYINSRLKTRTSIEDLECEDGSVARTDMEKAEELRRFFSSVFTVENLQQVPVFTDRAPSLCIDDLTFTTDDIRKRLKDLNPSKSPGPDGIHPRILVECAEQLCRPLATLCSLSMATGVLPSEWKRGNISAIFKKGNRHLASNYRPVSLTCIVCKLMEAIVKEQIMNHLLANDLLSDHQHGFVPGRSCSTQLLKVIDEWTNALDQGQPLDVVYLDFAKAFDSVPHKRLLCKLSGYGIRGKLLIWIEAFLSNRWQRVMVKGKASGWSEVSSGVPQGSVLGPLLFLIFINDLPDVVKSSMKIFADDTKVYHTVSTLPDIQELQDDIDALQTWSQNWQLPFNTKKCKLMHLGHRNDAHQYSMHGEVLQEIDNEKDLGVVVDSKLRFHLQTAQAVSRAFRMLGLMKRSFGCLNSQTIPILFKSVIRPILEYGNCVWGPLFRGDQDSVERVLRRATRLDPSLREHPYQERLKQTGIPSMYYRRQRGDMIMVYQIMTGRLQILDGQLLERADNRGTRGHHFKLKKPPVNTATRQHSFAIRVVNEWNGLPEDIISAPTVNTFKNRLDKHWKNRIYKTRHDE